jgi:hypothetical protein
MNRDTNPLGGSGPAPAPTPSVGLGGRETGQPLGAGNPLGSQPLAPPAPGGNSTSPTGTPPVGAPANLGSPPISVPAPAVAPKPSVSLAPQVKVIDVENYICKPGDTSFEILAKNYYHSERYGQALMRYNRDYHYRGAEDPLRLQPGMQVHFPPLHVLETNYGEAIPNHRPVPSAAAPETRSTGLSSPVSQLPGGERVAVAVPAVPVAGARPSEEVLTANAQATPRGTKTYRIQAPGGEQMRPLAQRTLGNPERWLEIYRLNPNLDPAQFIPSGTPVLLPGDARVD